MYCSCEFLCAGVSEYMSILVVFLDFIPSCVCVHVYGVCICAHVYYAFGDQRFTSSVRQGFSH